jgi:hypothetical protein
MITGELRSKVDRIWDIAGVDLTPARKRELRRENRVIISLEPRRVVYRA